jgi:cobalt-zinc-cadmium efflux system protein
MGHEHHHDHNHDTKNIKWAFFLNLLFTVVEIIGGLFTNSVAIMADALHDLGDSLSLGLAWYFQKLSKKGRDQNYSYGYRRFSLLAALINSIILVVGSIFILFETIPRLINPASVDAKSMIYLAIFGVIVNGAAVFKLTNGKSLNEKVVRLHLMEDVLGWVAVLIGSIIMYFFDWPIIDPILSLMISCYILFNVYSNLKGALQIFLQATPHEMNESKIDEYLKTINEIESYHDLHCWSMDGDYHILTIHIVVSEKESLASMAIIKDKLRKGLSELGFSHVTIEMESPAEICALEDC